MEIITGGVTAAKGFMAAGVEAGIKYQNRKDMAMVYSKTPCRAAGVFTTNVVKAAPVLWDKEVVESEWEAQAIVVKEGSPIASKADLTGKKISCQTSTTAAKFCRAEGYDVDEYAANNDAEMALVQGKVDAWVIDDLTAAEMVASYNSEHDDKLVILPDAMTTEPYAFAFAFGSEDLVEEVNKTIARLLEDGTIASIFEKFNAPYTSPIK